MKYNVKVGKHWSNKQNNGNSLHQISYRASFKSDLPNFFINKYTKEGDVVFDPFGGRGTTALEASLMNREPISNDINPLHKALLEPRFNTPTYQQVAKFLEKFEIKKERITKEHFDLKPFYNEDNLKELIYLRNYFINKKRLTTNEKWMRLVILSRLHGHSKGFISNYTLPPNQAIASHRQTKINDKNPDAFLYKDIKEIILSKTKRLLKDGGNKTDKYTLLNADSRKINSIESNTIDLVVTSPPFLDVINYKMDNWIRNWFLGKPIKHNETTMIKNEGAWTDFTRDVLKELKRMIKKDGHIAYEVGEVRAGRIDLVDFVIKAGESIGLIVEVIYIHDTKFSKTANIWGVDSNKKGTNTHRVVIFKKDK